MIEDRRREHSLRQGRDVSDRPKCPKCGSAHTVEIVCGHPTQELSEAANRGEVVLGGCFVDEDSPDRVCRACGHTWQTEL